MPQREHFRGRIGFAHRGLFLMYCRRGFVLFNTTTRCALSRLLTRRKIRTARIGQSATVFELPNLAGSFSCALTPSISHATRAIGAGRSRAVPGQGKHFFSKFGNYAFGEEPATIRGQQWFTEISGARQEDAFFRLP